VSAGGRGRDPIARHRHATASGGRAAIIRTHARNIRTPRRPNGTGIRSRSEDARSQKSSATIVSIRRLNRLYPIAAITLRRTAIRCVPKRDLRARRRLTGRAAIDPSGVRTRVSETIEVPISGVTSGDAMTGHAVFARAAIGAMRGCLVESRQVRVAGLATPKVDERTLAAKAVAVVAGSRKGRRVVATGEAASKIAKAREARAGSRKDRRAEPIGAAVNKIAREARRAKGGSRKGRRVAVTGEAASKIAEAREERAGGRKGRRAEPIGAAVNRIAEAREARAGSRSQSPENRNRSAAIDRGGIPNDRAARSHGVVNQGEHADLGAANRRRRVILRNGRNHRRVVRDARHEDRRSQEAASDRARHLVRAA